MSHRRDELSRLPFRIFNKRYRRRSRIFIIGRYVNPIVYSIWTQEYKGGEVGKGEKKKMSLAMSTLKLQSTQAGDILRSALSFDLFLSPSFLSLSLGVVGCDCPRGSASTNSTKWKTHRLSLKRVCVRGCVILKSTIIRQQHWIHEMGGDGEGFLYIREIVSPGLARNLASARKSET